MKGICEYKVIRDGKEINHGAKHNVIFELTKLRFQEYFNNPVFFGCDINRYPPISSGGYYNVPSALSPAAIELQEFFKGLRVFDENISPTSPADVKVPTLVAGPTKNASAPADYAQSSFSIDDSQMIISATWNLAADKTIRSLGLCHKLVAENPHNTGDWTGYISNSGSFGISIAAPAGAAKSISEMVVFGSYNGSRRVVRICDTTISLLGLCTKHTPIASDTSSGDYQGGEPSQWHWCLNHDNTLLYVIDGTTIKVYTVSTGALLKTYTVPSFGTILFSSERDVYISASGTAVLIKELSKTDNTVIDITSLTAPIALTYPKPVNDTYVCFSEGFIVGMPDADDNVKTFYNYNNNPQTYNKIIMQHKNNVLISVVKSTTGIADFNAARAAVALSTGIIDVKWMNTTALNFDEPIELLSGDTFVITYKIQLS